VAESSEDKGVKIGIDLCAASALNVVNIGGVFVVLLCGLSVAILVAIMEFCWKARKATTTTTTNNQSHPILGQVRINIMSADSSIIEKNSIRCEKYTDFISCH
jgi:hypothetical protein